MAPFGCSANNSPTQDEMVWINARKAEKTRLRRIRESRIRALKREIQMARTRLREYDHFLAELHDLEKDRVDELRETERNRRACAPPTRWC
jgi:hypothetical protein